MTTDILESSYNPQVSPCCDPQAHIVATNVGLTYAQKTAYRDVNLTVNKGCITALVGPSGCGKTSFLTSLNRLSDLIPQCRVSGTIHIDGTNILDRDCDVISLRRRVGMIFQKPQPFPFSIRKNMTMPLREHGMRSAQDRENALEQALRDVGLWDEIKDRLDHSALALSGGQQQRLCLARTLALKPDILLLDEPCSALDPLASAVVEDLILSFRHRYTVVIVTHNLAQARRVADNVAVFWTQNGSGQLIESGSTHDIFETPQHACTQAYIAGAQG